MWTVQHLWMSRAHFFFNCYRRWSLLVLRDDNGTASFLISKEGVTQGDHIAMIAYGIIITPLIKNLKWDIPDVTQPWYADDVGSLVAFARIENFLIC